MKTTVIIHGRRIPGQKDSPRKGREHAELWTSNNNVVDYWDGDLDWTRHFDLHPVERCAHYREGIKGYRPETWEWYTRNAPVPTGYVRRPNEYYDRFVEGSVLRDIILLEAHPEVPGSAPYPLETIANYFGRTSGSNRFTTTVDMQIALALYEGVDEIILNGVGLITADHRGKTALRPEWQMKHKGINWWIGLAEGRGVKVTVEGPSIFTPQGKVYGYETSGRDMEVALRGLVLSDMKHGRDDAEN